MFICELLDFRWCGNNNLLEYRCSELGHYFSFRLCSTGLGRVEVLFCQLCIFTATVLGWRGRPFNIVGLEHTFSLWLWRPCSKAVRCTFFNRSMLLTSNLTARARIKLFVLASVFIATVPLGKGVFTQSIFICCLGIVVIRHMGSRLWLTVEYCRIILWHRLAQVALG